MPSFNSDIQANAVSGALASRNNNSALTSGQKRHVSALITTTAAWAANDLVHIATLPIGSVLIPEECRVSMEACGGTGTAFATLGDDGDDDRYSATSISLTSAATTAVTPTAANALAPYAIAAGNEVIKAKVALSSGTVTAGKLIRVRLTYIAP